MNRGRFGIAVVAAIIALAGAEQVQAFDVIYENTDVASLAPKYERGWRDNFNNVFSKVFTNEERSRLSGVNFRMNLQLPGHEPFGFFGGGGTVLASAASMRFLEDLALAHTWLDRNGFAPQSLADYLLML